jgi:hypothetical protein
MPTTKRGTSFRLSNQCLSHIKDISDRDGISQTAVLEMCLRRWEREDCGQIDDDLRCTVRDWREATSPLKIRPMRLSDQARDIVNSLATHRGISQAEVLELCIAREVRNDAF